MFSVPGWAVSPASLVQQMTTEKGRGFPPSSNQQGSTRKRKRENAPLLGHSLSANEIEKLWNQSQHGAESKHKSTSKKSSRDAKHKKNLDSKPVQAGRQKQSRTRGPRVTPPSSTEASYLERSSMGGKGELSHHSNVQAVKEYAKSERTQKHVESQTKDHKSITTGSTDTGGPVHPTLESSVPISDTLTPLQAKMRHKLTSARFRHLNQTLYTTPSSDAWTMFKASPELFAEYHAGFSQQVKESWPQNPVEQYVKEIIRRGQASGDDAAKDGRVPLPRNRKKVCTIADLGCGDAPLARGCQSRIKALQLKFRNFDLHAANSLVEVADVANLPLRDGEVDIAIFCLSLMGTNWVKFVEEAWRVLRADGKGEVWVSEVKSRFGRSTAGQQVPEKNAMRRRKIERKSRDSEEEPTQGEGNFAEEISDVDQGADTTDISAFVRVFERRGFELRGPSVNKTNKMFVSMVFIKTGIPTAGRFEGLKWTGKQYHKTHSGEMKFIGGTEGLPADEESKALKPCVYKTR